MTNTAHSGGAVPTFEMRHRLSLALEHSRVSVNDMAIELGIHRNTVGRYLAGQSTPNRAIMRVWALRTGVPLEWLLTGQVPDDDGTDGGTRAVTLGYLGAVTDREPLKLLVAA